jgi:hypothetical protein
MGIITTGPGSPLTTSSASGGKTYGYNNITDAQNTIVANANPQRQEITFHNPGTVDIFVSQTVIQNILGTAPTQPSDVAFVPTTSAFGGTYRVFANGGQLTVKGECQKAWQALAASGTTNPLTVTESNA